MIKIKLSNEEQLIILTKFLISTVDKSDKESAEQREQLDFYRSKIEELNIENKKLKDDKTVTYNIDIVTPF